MCEHCRITVWTTVGRYNTCLHYEINWTHYDTYYTCITIENTIVFEIQ